jgi:hypothetical protein
VFRPAFRKFAVPSADLYRLKASLAFKDGACLKSFLLIEYFPWGLLLSSVSEKGLSLSKNRTFS